MATPLNSKRGPKFLQVDTANIERLASIGCSMENIAYAIGVGTATITDRADLQEAFKIGRARMQQTLIQKMWDTAIHGGRDGNGDPTMMIWLAKNLLGWSDRTVGTAEGMHISITFE
jgi:hypothetical protein